MELTKENIVEWKQKLDELMKEYLPQTEKYSDTMSNEEILDMYEVFTPEFARDEELSAGND